MYTAETIALCALEVFVHLPSSLLPKDFSVVTIDVSEDASLRTIEVEQLEANWSTHPAPFVLAKLGDEWVRENKQLLLRVPSAVIPQEWNVLINPTHPDFDKQVTIANVEPFMFDVRMRKTGE